MLGINRKLEELEKKGEIIKVGLVGAGQMGRGMVSQIENMSGMRVVLTADIQLDNVVNAYLKAGVENLFDTSYSTYANWNNIPRMGRNFFVNVSYVIR